MLIDISNSGIHFRVDEPYTCEKLESLPHTQLTDWYRCMEVRFTCDDHLDGARPQEVINLQVRTCGVVDAIAVCFDLILTDMEPSHIVTTLPEVAGYSSVHPCCTAWDQALFFMDGDYVAIGENVCLHASAEVDRLSFQLPDREGGRKRGIKVCAYSPGLLSGYVESTFCHMTRVFSSYLADILFNIQKCTSKF